MATIQSIPVRNATRLTRSLGHALMLALASSIALPVPVAAQGSIDDAAARRQRARPAVASTAPAPLHDTVPNGARYRLGPGDVLRISVYNNPDLSTEAQVSTAGHITFPLLGEVDVGGRDTASVEKLIGRLLSDHKYVVSPQVNVLISQYRSQQVSVLGHVVRPGRISLDTASSLTDLLATAGGIAPNGADVAVIVSKASDGSVNRHEVDLKAMLLRSDMAQNVAISNGDIIYVPRAPMFYIYGEVQHPGTYRLERDMTVMQALSVGGGLTPRGTQRGVEINRKDDQGRSRTLTPKLADRLKENDVIFVKESLF